MNCIINPSVFYWMDVIGTIKIVTLTALFISLVIITTSLIAYGTGEMLKPVFKKICILMGAIISFSVIGMIFIPSKDTMYKMLVASQVTEENIDKAQDVIKSTADYIIESIQRVNN